MQERPPAAGGPRPRFLQRQLEQRPRQSPLQVARGAVPPGQRETEREQADRQREEDVGDPAPDVRRERSSEQRDHGTDGTNGVASRASVRGANQAVAPRSDESLLAGLGIAR
jgi:hypothetical protein